MRAPPNELDEGLKALESLLSNTRVDTDWNEAETRFQFIDRLLEDCLGWPRQWFAVEKQVHEGYSDYVLGQPHLLVIEAKRAGAFFEIPVTIRQSAIRNIPSLIKTSTGLKAAMEQVIRYCAGLGIEYGAVCNGRQLVVFIAVRTDKPPLEGRAVVVEDVGQYKTLFPTLWQNLSPEALRQRRLTRTLTLDAEAAVPPKLSTSVLSFHQHRYKTPLQTNLRALADLLINDIPEADDIVESFFHDCYCSTQQLTQYTMLSDRIMRDRYAALFGGRDDAPSVATLASSDLISGPDGRSIAVEALARRPIVLLGDAGVGKSSFLRNLILRKSREAFRKAIYILIDLGTSGTLTSNIREFILDQVQDQLYSKYGTDTNEKKFVRSIYDLEIRKFKKSVFAGPSVKSGEPTGINEYLQSLARNKPEHLKKSISHLSRGRRQQVVIIIDNADQRNFNDQQEAFLASQEIASGWNSLAYVSLRPETFHESKHRGTLSAYVNRVFTILPPPPAEALVKRLVFALRIAEGQVNPEVLRNISLNLESITTVLGILVRSINANEDIRRFITNVTGGNMRQLIELFTMFIGSPNVDFDKMLRIEKEQGNYIIPLHEFSKHALLGEYAHYSPSSSLAANLFDVSRNDAREHFLAPLILSFLNHPGQHRDNDGFVLARGIMSEMQSRQFLPDQIRTQIQRLNSKRLIEAIGRAAGSGGVDDHREPLADGYRITSIGAYHLLGWMPTFAYLDAMSFDTPIFSDASWDVMAEVANSFDIADRLSRTKAFLKYLSEQWHSSGLNAVYFDWGKVERSTEDSLTLVDNAVARRARFASRRGARSSASTGGHG